VHLMGWMTGKTVVWELCGGLTVFIYYYFMCICRQCLGSSAGALQ